jgi:hypothetical protein
LALSCRRATVDAHAGGHVDHGLEPLAGVHLKLELVEKPHLGFASSQWFIQPALLVSVLEAD